jgi:hypothetical protein
MAARCADRVDVLAAPHDDDRLTADVTAEGDSVGE